MRSIGRDYHASWQRICWMETTTGETGEVKLEHASGEAGRFYRQLPGHALIGMESTGNCQWFVDMVTRLGHDLWVGDAARIRACDVRQQKHNQRAAALIVFAFFLFLVPSLTLARPGAAGPVETHDREFWRTIVKNRFAVPEGQPVFPLVRELSGLLGSPDPELRDDLAYSIIGTWIARRKQLSGDELNSLADEWRANLKNAVGESGTDTVFKRSFSALCLSAIAERDLQTPFLSAGQFQALLDDALAYLKQERDLRGFDPVKGWIHATAHAADLLSFLAANPLLKSEDQSRLLQAVSERLSTAREIFSYGEQDRLAMIPAAIVSRKDFDSAKFHQWLSELDADQKVWRDSPPRQELLQTFENDSAMLRTLAVQLCAKSDNSQSVEVQKMVLQILRRR